MTTLSTAAVTGVGSVRPPTRVRPGRRGAGVWRWVVLTVAGLYFLVPIGASVWFTVRDRGQGGLTLEHYAGIPAAEGFAETFGRSLALAHDQAEALSVADRVGVLRAGRLEQVASPDELYERPATAFVAEFVGTMNRLPATLVGGGVELLGVRRPVAGAAPSAGPVVALVRPESLMVATDPEGSGRVVTRTFSGASTRLAVALPGGAEVAVDVASAGSQDLTPGTAVTVTPAERPVLVAPAEPGAQSPDGAREG